MKKLILILTILLSLSQNLIADTEVGGPVTEDTLWIAQNSPYLITSTVQIDEGVTLSIEAGVEISKPSSGDLFLIHGTLYAHGNAYNKIIIDGGGNSDIFTTWGGAGTASLDYCEIKNGYHLWNRGGYFELRNSLLANLTEGIHLESPSGDTSIEYNAFVNTGGIGSYQTAGRSSALYIRYNLFKNLLSSLHNYGGFPGQNDMLVNYNAFITPNSEVLSLAQDFESATMNGTNNYWGTGDTASIELLIYDKNDDIRCENYIDYLPVLSAPHSDIPELDEDLDGVPDATDNCIDDYNPNQSDTDGDDVGDVCDTCLNDPNKIDAGVCGCGIPDTDTDNDLAPDCVDNCPNDPNKINPGICGCGVADSDSDQDGTPDCNDDCDSNLDTDGDGVEDCDESCPNDPDKTDPGVCGCGLADTDTDNDGIPNCVDFQLIANITSPASNRKINVGKSVNFQCSVLGGNPPYTYLWNFDGGADNSTQRNPGDVTFAVRGTYNVTLAVADGNGDIGSDTVTISVKDESDDDDDDDGNFCFFGTME